MDNAIVEYQKRRQARLDAKAIEKYRIRRDARLKGRMDADGDEEGNNRPSGGGHGNTKIPFGLCRREGIQIDPKWSPKDAWDALAGKGYSAGEVYKELKATGKVGAKKAKTPKRRIEPSHFPSEMVSKTYRKNTMAFASYINDHCDDGNITEFFSSATLSGAKAPPVIKCKRTKDPSGSQVASRIYRESGELAEAEITIPSFSSIKDESLRAQAVRTFAHEWTHYLDLCARSGTKFGHFSSEFKDLQDAIKADDGSVGEEAGNLFKKFNSEYDDAKVKEREARTDAIKTMVRNRYGEIPRWVRDDGSADYSTAIRSGVSYSELKAFERERKKTARAVEIEWQEKRRALMDGVANLQGLYDSLNGGNLRENGTVKYGHSKRYFRGDPSNKPIEMLADYVALKATNPRLAAVFEKDKPEIARQLDAEIAEITKRLRGE